MRAEELEGPTLRETLRKRAGVLASIRDVPAGKPALVERLDVSRSTVDRAVDSLVETGQIRRVDGEYRATAHGRLALDTYQEYVDLTDTLAESAPLLDGLPADVSVDRALFESGTVRVAEPHAPENAITEAVKELQFAERLLVFSPVVKSNYVRLVQEQVEERGLDVTLVLETGASESMAALTNMTETIAELVESESFSLFRTDRELPFMLYLMLGDESDTVGITVHEDGGIVGSVTASDPDAVAWGQEWFDDVMTDTETVQPSSLL